MYYLGDEITAKYEHYIKSYLGREFQHFKKILRESEGVISGSSVLSIAFPGKKFFPNDFDIYVKIENSKPLLEFIFEKENTRIYKKANFGRYCPTFLTKNGIRAIYNNMTFNCFGKNVDVMTVRNSTTPVDVVSKFDLTFCQVWYDGDKVYANHPEDIKSGIGRLTKDYTIPFLNNNKFLLARYAKYTERGFTIKAEFPDEHTIIQDMMGLSNIRKFKQLSKADIESIYDTDSKKKHFVAHFILEKMTEGADGYDSEEYEDITSLYEFGQERVDVAIKNFKDKLLQNATNTNNNIYIVNWIKIYQNK